MSYFDEGPIQTADSFERTDLTQHRAYLNKLVAAWRSNPDDKVAVGQATVVTGEILDTGRGKEEAKDERAFRRVAGELNVGIRVTHRHLPDGTTVLRLSPQEKKVFSDEAIAKRTAALDKRRERLAIEKYAKATNKTVQQLTKEEVTKVLNDYRASKSNGQTTKAQGTRKSAS